MNDVLSSDSKKEFSYQTITGLPKVNEVGIDKKY